MNAGGSANTKMIIASIMGSLFTQNYAMGAGGAVYSTDQLIFIENCRFQSNIVNLTNNYFSDTSSQGGAIYLTPSISKSIIANCSFIENIAMGGWGGAVFGISAQVWNKNC
jgi:predicted outer membrane repeat protein